MRRFAKRRGSLPHVGNHPPIRAREVVGSRTRRDVFVKRHLAYFVKLAEQAEPELYRSNQVFWLNRLDEDLDNLRMALEWALTKDIKAGLELITVPVFFWEIHKIIQEWQSWLAQFLERISGAQLAACPTA